MPAAPEAFYFGPPDRPLMGFWHAPRAPAQPLAVVLVGPWGIEGMNLQRTWRHFAQDLAAQGFPVLRFDLDGCGDAHSPPDDADLWPLWNESLRRAKQIALTRAGVGQVALVGFRLGALLAAHHAHTELDNVCGLVALAPPRSGQAFVRELKMLEASTHPTPAPAPWDLVAAGFGLSKATATSLKHVRLPDTLSGLPVALVDRQEAPTGPDWPHKLATHGSAIVYTTANGYPDMQRPAYEVVPARAFFDQAASRLRAFAHTAIACPRNAPTPSQQTTTWMPHRGKRVREWATPHFNAKGMAAIVVQPDPEATPNHSATHTVLVLNSSTEHRVGPNRFWVDWARDVALEGITVVRLDLPGIGESEGGYTPAASQVYRDDAVNSTRQAMDWLGEQLGTKQWALVGLCSGAYHAISVALQDERVNRVLAINPLVFPPTSVENLDLTTGNAMQHMVAAHTLKSAKDPQRWLRLLRGESDIRLIVQSMLGLTRTKCVKQGLDLGRRLKLLPATPLATSLTTATARGCRFHFVFDANEPGWAILKEDIGSLADRMLANGRFTLDTIPNGGHSFATLEGRAKMLACTQAHLQAWANPTN